MKEININGRMLVKTLKKQFVETFGLSLRVYEGQHFADESKTLASIRKEGKTGGELMVAGQMQVGNFENKMLEEYGIKVQVANADDSKLVDNKLTLASASKGETKATTKAPSTAKSEAKATGKTKTYTLTMSGTFYGLKLANIDLENPNVVESVRNADLDDYEEVVDVLDKIVRENDNVECAPEMFFFDGEKQCIENVRVEDEDGNVVYENDDLEELEEWAADICSSPCSKLWALEYPHNTAEERGILDMSADNEQFVNIIKEEHSDDPEGFEDAMAALRMDVDSGIDEVPFVPVSSYLAKSWHKAIENKLPRGNGVVGDALLAMAEEASLSTPAETCRLLAHLNHYGEASVTIYITLPEDEEFDFDKLHLIQSEEWWDRCKPFYAENLRDLLSETLGPIEVVEYGGKFFYADNQYTEAYDSRDSAAAICDIMLSDATLD